MGAPTPSNICTNFYVLVEFELEQGTGHKKRGLFFDFHFSLLPRGIYSIHIRCTYLHTPKYARHWHSFSKTNWSNWPFCLWWPFWPRCFIFHSFSSHKKNFKPPRTTPHFSISRITVRLDTYQYQLQATLQSTRPRQSQGSRITVRYGRLQSWLGQLWTLLIQWALRT